MSVSHGMPDGIPLENREFAKSFFNENASLKSDVDGTITIDDFFNGEYDPGMQISNDHVSVDNFVFIVDGIILTLVSIFGVVGTSMAIIVLIKPRLRGNSRDLFSKFLTALAVYDTLFLFLALLLFGLPALSVW